MPPSAMRRYLELVSYACVVPAREKKSLRLKNRPHNHAILVQVVNSGVEERGKRKGRQTRMILMQ